MKKNLKILMMVWGFLLAAQTLVSVAFAKTTYSYNDYGSDYERDYDGNDSFQSSEMMTPINANTQKEKHSLHLPKFLRMPIPPIPTYLTHKFGALVDRLDSKVNDHYNLDNFNIFKFHDDERLKCTGRVMAMMPYFVDRGLHKLALSMGTLKSKILHRDDSKIPEEKRHFFLQQTVRGLGHLALFPLVAPATIAIGVISYPFFYQQHRYRHNL